MSGNSMMSGSSATQVIRRTFRRPPAAGRGKRHGEGGTFPPTTIPVATISTKMLAVASIAYKIVRLLANLIFG
jgi:hypothetical protein